MTVAEALRNLSIEDLRSRLADPYRIPSKPGVQLLQILGEALNFAPAKYFPNLYLDSILGRPIWKLTPPQPRSSEFSVLSLRDVLKSLRYIMDVTIPAVPTAVPSGFPILGESTFFRETTIQFQPGFNDNPYTFPDEAWIFINGIVTNQAVARINAEYLVSMFHRPLALIQNATDSIGVDLTECVLGKTWAVHTEPAAKAYPFIHRALHDPSKKRVVVICHSQGTIITSNVLRGLVDDSYREELKVVGQRAKQLEFDLTLAPLEDAELLNKLEIYAFANCANVMAWMPGVTTARGNPVPWIENFGNENDVVARLGMLAPRRRRHGIRIDGTRYIRQGKWGHYLNLHYLWELKGHLESPARYPNQYLPLPHDDGSSPPQRPRLFDYFGGRTPPPY